MSDLNLFGHFHEGEQDEMTSKKTIFADPLKKKRKREFSNKKSKTK